MKKVLLSALGLVVLLGASCQDEAKVVPGAKFDPDKDIVVKGFYPDSGGIATPMIIQGENFGSDTTGLRVNFVDENGTPHRGGLVSSNGTEIYVMVPSGLTNSSKPSRPVEIRIARDLGDDGIREYPSEKKFIYKTQTSVVTVVGTPAKDHQKTVVGTSLTSSQLSSPTFVTLDNEDNIFVVERKFPNRGLATPNFQAMEGGDGQGNILRANLIKDELIVLKNRGANSPNAPTFLDEAGFEAIYVPQDPGAGYFQMAQAINYEPRELFFLSSDADLMKSDWKYSFVTNKNNKQIYTLSYHGKLIKLNPKTRFAEKIIEEAVGPGGSDSFCAFSPVDPDMLYISFADQNQIWRVNVSTMNVEKYAGASAWLGKEAGKGFEDGSLRTARFNRPVQIAFTKDGKLFIADAGNHCIRMIDTTLGDKATVVTAIGLPETPGFKDGGPDIAKFRIPTGIAVNNDGSELYVADLGNRVVRKLSIQ